MSKTLKTVGMIAGAVALVATGVGAFAVAGSALAATAASVASIATITAAAANAGSATLAKPPSARGSVTQMLIQADAPQPYVMGEGHFAGVLRHDTGYGGKIDGVDNPYRFMAVVYSGGGPIQSITPQVDYGAVGAYYSGWLYTSTQLGATPEAAALGHSLGSTPTGWGSAYKLSGQAAIGWNFKFDKKGKKFASGLPLLGASIQGVKVYDPRLDDTFPGGVGPHRLGVESTYTYSANPALHAGTYAYGRYQNAKRVLGIGLPSDGIDWETVASWANACELNAWTMFGVAYEPGDKGQNLRDICAAGGGEPVFANAVLSFRYSAPVVALDTISEEDIADEPGSVTFMQSYRDRLNTIVPKYRSPDHNWEMVNAEPVQVATYLAEDGGEERREEWPFNYVKSATQAAQLAAYRLVDSRELHPIQLVCKPRLRAYRPGDCLRLDQPQLGLDTDAIVISRSLDPATMKVTLTLIGETPTKHAYALGLTGVPPETPALSPTAEEADEVSLTNSASGVAQHLTTSGRAGAEFVSSSDARPFAKIIASGEAVNGEVVSFGATYADVPKISFGMGGAAPSTGSEVQVRADSLTTSGFTMKAVEVALTPGTTYTDTTDAVGGAGVPDRVMHKTQNLEPWDGKYTYTLSVTVPEISPGEPGILPVDIYARVGGTWTVVGSAVYTSSGSYDVVVTPGTIAQTADNEFGASVRAGASSGATLDDLFSVKYTSGTVTETPLTTNTAIPWIAYLEQ